jgi:hypothetical protein
MFDGKSLRLHHRRHRRRRLIARPALRNVVVARRHRSSLTTVALIDPDEVIAATGVSRRTRTDQPERGCNDGERQSFDESLIDEAGRHTRAHKPGNGPLLIMRVRRGRFTTNFVWPPEPGPRPQEVGVDCD